MKHALLLTLLFTFSTLAIAQDNLGDRLALKSSDRSNGTLNIKIYPNPATSHIGLSNSESVERLVIFNMVGRKMKSFEVERADDRYFVGDLPRGMYLVQLMGNDNEILTTKRVNKR